MRKKGDFETQKDVLLTLMDIFRCLPQADLFIRAYEKEFASRLISKSSDNDDLEEFFITTLKNECGEPLTKRLVDLKRNYE